MRVVKKLLVDADEKPWIIKLILYVSSLDTLRKPKLLLENSIWNFMKHSLKKKPDTDYKNTGWEPYSPHTVLNVLFNY